MGQPSQKNLSYINTVLHSGWVWIEAQPTPQQISLTIELPFDWIMIGITIAQSLWKTHLPLFPITKAWKVENNFNIT